MNILQLAKYYPPIYGGIELVEKMMTKAHRDNNDSVFICAFAESSKEELGEFNEKILRIHEKLNILGAPFSLQFFFSFKSFILKNKICKIYVHLPNPFMHEVVKWNAKIIKKHNIEVIGVYHSDIINKSFLGALYNYYFLKTSNVYTKILVSSKELWDSSSLLKKIPEKKQAVIPYCIEESNFQNSEKKFSNNLISIGRLVPYKGFEFLIRTFNNTQYDLHIVGNGPLIENLHQIAAKNIYFHHNLTNIEKNKLLLNSGLMIIGSNSRAEAYGMTIVEAFSQAIPVIAPILNTGVNYLVKNESTGLTYSVEDSNELLNQVNKIKNDPVLYSKLSNDCYSFFVENLTYEKFKARLLNI